MDPRRGAFPAPGISAEGKGILLRNVGNEDLIMVYGTSTVFNPEWEGRIASDVEKAPLPQDWDRYLAG